MLIRLRNSLIFRSFDEYAREPVGKAMGFLAVLVLLVSLPVLGMYCYNLMQGIDEMTKEAAKMPDFTFSGGKLTVNAPMPIVQENGASLIVIDTSNQTPPTVLDQYADGMIIYNDRMIQKQAGGSTRETKFEPFAKYSFNKAELIRAVPYLKWISVLVVVFGLIYFFLGKLLQATVFALIGLVVGAIRKTEFGYGSAFIIAIYALIWPSVIQAVLRIGFDAYPYPYPGWTYWGLFLICMIAGVIMATPPKTEPVPEAAGAPFAAAPTQVIDVTPAEPEADVAPTPPEGAPLTGEEPSKQE